MSSSSTQKIIEDHKEKLLQESSNIENKIKANLKRLQEKKQQKEAEKAAAAAAAAEEERLQAERKAAAKLAKKKEKEARKRKEAAARAKQEALQASARAKQEARILTQQRKDADKALLQQFQQRQGASSSLYTSEHIPKRSALLARGGSFAEAYQTILEQEALAKWKIQAGSRWKILDHQTFDGTSSSETKKEEAIFVDTLQQGIDLFKSNPHKYLSMHYPKHMEDEDCSERPLIFILREGTTRYQPLSVYEDDRGRFRLFRHLYQRLKPLKGDVLPSKDQDKHTSKMSFGGRPLTSGDGSTPPMLPGRGMGVGDDVGMCFLGDADASQVSPSDVCQGSIGDCWLLSAIACLADFDFAIRRLFRKTPSPVEPTDAPNSYTVTLWDLSTWKEVDVVVDERLPLAPVASPAGASLLGAKPSSRAATWVPYLEKAIAIHCGGYDKLVGGNCTNAWPLLTGSRNQFLLSKVPQTGKYACGARFDPSQCKWSKHSNSPHDYDQTMWRAEWPKVGGGGSRDLDLTPKEVFRRLVVWEKHNFLIGAATGGVSDQETTDGIIDNHAYSVIDSEPDVCGSGIDLLLIRNPWGEGGELQNGQFMRGGKGWKKYPKVFKKLHPPNEDNGMCWVTKEEFFQYFPTICVCAMDTNRLKDPSYANDLEDHFPREAPEKARPKAPIEEEEVYPPIIIDTSSVPGSPYKIVEQSFNGGVSYNKMNKKVVKAKSIVQGVEKFKKNPKKYLAIHWQRSICSQGWPDEVHQFTYIYREGTEDLDVDDAAGNEGERTILTNVLR